MNETHTYKTNQFDKFVWLCGCLVGVLGTVQLWLDMNFMEGDEDTIQ